MVRGESDPEETSIHIDYDDLIRTVQAGDKITVDSGLINLEVLEKHERMMLCRVLDGGVLKSKIKERQVFQSEGKVVVISDVLAGSGKIDAIQIQHLP